ncbi:MAG: Protein MraZ [Parcubacteria group bacterium GW2011_GWE2_39_37]|uniref:Transcriptional regulator MraZ n=1 Tax=Candidatus Falkowbacteria bacterium GW2011_GWF2_39_8 TaxID=1618642 RepID=A0A0G0PXE7_9BACT|nr:MAG: Protein MraZ [Parcubacteria group bacterium GW2011_GWE2_39_37]KKR32809.1 MAG: Protein MraZ [Candidatus Falkowbacteria bacterium GW2011_GWF2_39_8]
MFIGEYNHNLDEKGRLAVPSKFRVLLKGGAIVTRGLDNCLYLYPKKQWAKVAEKLAGLPTTSNPAARAYARSTLGGAMDVDFDNQGRIVLPEYLRNFSALKKKVVIVGLYDKLEIWNEENWNKYKTKAEKDNNSIAESLGELGI